MSVVYHGLYSDAGGAVILVEEADSGAQLGVLRHVIRHSPTGMGWGYAGSGAADCARSLLIAVLDTDAICPTCAGGRRVVFDPASGRDRPYPPVDGGAAGADAVDPGLVSACLDCVDGFRDLPYQLFKAEVIAGLPEGEWRLTATEIRGWLAAHDVPLA